ncbi:carbohydrate binding domain-containing protein [Catenuloplanes atrovinosus]|uniref:CBM-cenC domain-containing protein n=1 Tax=Catenuloplanes atrovinosus TaxID=137266 RepID=A0AAE4CBC0_9ACTN|nr:carbohydrate binding domain-containing protein [Catenuloplanes atrovinosus]MDR7277887.1 hypothetical protein [Catenuloplanes atrovinosus]
MGDGRDDPVRRFCDELSDLVRDAGLKRADVVRAHPMSESQVYAVLRGEVRTPPPFDRMVLPIVQACGADEERVKWWRSRHAMMVREHELYRRRPAPSAEPPEPAAPAPAPARPGPRRRRLVLAIAGAVVAAVTALSVVAVWLITRGPDREALPPVPTCTEGPPAVGGDLLDVPRPTPPDDPRFDDWWANHGGVRLEDSTRRSWRAVVNGGSNKPHDLIVVRGCLPVTSGHRYRLSFRARADTDVSIRVRVQLNRPPNYEESLYKTIDVTTEAQTYSWTFTGEHSSLESELTFQLGGHPDFTIEVADVALTRI